MPSLWNRILVFYLSGFLCWLKTMVFESRFYFCCYFGTSAALGYWLGNLGRMLNFAEICNSLFLEYTLGLCQS